MRGMGMPCHKQGQMGNIQVPLVPQRLEGARRSF